MAADNAIVHVRVSDQPAVSALIRVSCHLAEALRLVLQVHGCGDALCTRAQELLDEWDQVPDVLWKPALTDGPECGTDV